MARKLYIIGNGFDLSHGIASSYEDFMRFMEDSQKYGQLYVMLLDFYSQDGDLWCDFETTLGKIKAETIHRFSEQEANAAELDEKLLHLQQDLMEWTADGIHGELAEAFTDWVRQIDINGVWQAYNIDTGALFFTFNYTKTLEQVYQIPENNVKHIHLDRQRPVFGHGRQKHNEQWPMPGYESVITDFAKDKAKELFNEFVKPVPDIIRRNAGYFSSLAGNVDEIHVIGHSLSQVDLPYFKEIHQQCPGAPWHVYYYDPGGRVSQSVKQVEYTSKLGSAGIPTNQIFAISDKRILV